MSLPKCLTGKFQDLLKIYLEQPGSNRQEKYNISEKIYHEKHGEYAYDDFRKFGALLSMFYSSGTPHESAVANYKRKAAR